MEKYYPVEKGRDALGSEMEEIQNDAGRKIGKRKQGFWAKVLPSKLDKVNTEHLVELARIEGDYRERALQIIKKAQLQCIEEKYNDWLVRGKIDIRGRRAAAVLEQKNLLEENIMTLSNQFEDRIQQEAERAEQSRNPMFREKKIQMIEASIVSYFDLTQQLQQEFQNILNEGVQA